MPVIVTSEDSASRVTGITHWPVLASGVAIILASYKGIICRSFLVARQVIEKSYPLAGVRSCYPTSPGPKLLGARAPSLSRVNGAKPQAREGPGLQFLGPGPKPLVEHADQGAHARIGHV